MAVARADFGEKHNAGIYSIITYLYKLITVFVQRKSA